MWQGPEVDGITQSLLSRFLVCRERFRVYAIEGLQPHKGFIPVIEYGQMWHACEEALAAGDSWQNALKLYCAQLMPKYRDNPNDQKAIVKWYNVCLKQFPVYIEYWETHKDVRDRTPIYQEKTFKIPYELPSGRVVLLRGKWDSVDLIGKGKSAGVYLQENKTKGMIDSEYLSRQLTFDMQTMMYLIALGQDKGLPAKIKGVRYNVIRRPLSGGKGTIRQRQPTKSNPSGESESEFYDRLAEYFIEEPEEWFYRWKVEITEGDIELFKQQFFHPCLEQLCLWYDSVTGKSKNHQYLHYRLPYGVFNPLLEGKGTDLDEYLNSGSSVGLQQVETLFEELE